MSLEDPILLDVPDAFEGPRVFARAYRTGDGAALFAGIDQHREALSTWLGWLDEYPSVAYAEVYARRQAAKWLLREQFITSLWLQTTGEFIGDAGFHRVDWRLRQAELGFFLLPPFEGQGFACEAVSMLVRFAFGNLGMRRLEAQCDVDNLRSAVLLDRLGFAYEGRKRQSFLDHKDTMRDLLFFAKLAG